jgi:hypothetical protein
MSSRLQDHGQLASGSSQALACYQPNLKRQRPAGTCLCLQCDAHMEIAAVQAADYLGANLQTWCAALWQRAPAVIDAAAMEATLRNRLPSALYERVCSRHPAIARQEALQEKVARLPPSLHPFAFHSCAEPVCASDPSRGLRLQLLLVDLATCNAASAALLQVPDLRRVDLALLTHVPRPAAREDAALRRVSAQLQRAPKERIELHVSCNGWITRPRGVAVICGNLVRQLSHLPATRSLAMDGLRMRDTGAAMLAKSVTALTNLTSLKLSNSHIAGPGALAWSWAVQNLPQLQQLDYKYQWTSCAPIGALALADAVRRTPGITHLSLNSTRHDGAADSAVERLALASTLQELDLTAGLVHGPIGDGASRYEGGALVALARMTQLTSLSLGHSQLPTGRADALGVHLAALLQLRALTLFNMPLGAETMPALAQALRCVTCLTTLHISRAQLNVNTLAELAPAIAKCSQLHGLHFTYDPELLLLLLARVPLPSCAPCWHLCASCNCSVWPTQG